MPLFRQNYLKIYSYPTKFISSSGAFSPLRSRFLPALPILSPMGESTELQTSGARADIRSTGGHQEHRRAALPVAAPDCWSSVPEPMGEGILIPGDERILIPGGEDGIGSTKREGITNFAIPSLYFKISDYLSVIISSPMCSCRGAGSG